MKKVLVTFLVLIIVSGNVSLEQPTIVVVTNSIDYSFDLIAYLERAFDVISISGDQFAAYQDYDMYVIVGGPDAPGGIGEIVRSILPLEDQEEIRVPGSYDLYVAADKGKTFFVLAGAHREQTQRATITLKSKILSLVPWQPLIMVEDLDIRGVTDMVITDLDNDQISDYVFACHRVVSDPWDRAGIYVYENRQLQWYYHLSAVIKAFTCYDLNYDGVKEIVVACEILEDRKGDLYVFDNKGELIWRRQVPGSPRGVYCYKNYAAVSLYGEGNRVLIFNDTGDSVRDLPVGGSISKFIIEDVNKDGKYELVTSCILNDQWEHFLVVYDLSGTVLWNFTTHEHINDFQFLDIDGDEYLETILVSYDHLFVTRGGELLGKIHMPPPLLQVKVTEDQIMVANSNTIFLISIFDVLNLEGETIPLVGFPQVVISHLPLEFVPEFFFLEDVDYDDSEEIVVGDGIILEVHEFNDFVLGVAGFLTTPAEMLEGVPEEVEEGEEAEEISEAEFIIYTNADYGLRIKYHWSWTVEEKPEDEDMVVFFLSPREDVQDIFRENAGISVMELDPEVSSLEDAISIVILAAQMTPDFELVESASATLAGLPGHKIVFTGTFRDLELEWMQVFTVKSNKMYLITYTATIAGYPRFLPVVQEMVSSFDIGKMLPVTICNAQFDAPGDDNADPNGEWIRICNKGDTDIDISGWELINDVGAYYEFPAGSILRANSSVTVYTGTGENTETEFHWGRPVEAWNNAGDTAVLTDSEGNNVATYAWAPE